MRLLIIGPYPVRNNGISKYIAQYRSELLRRGHDVATECMYFWRNKAGDRRWLSLRARLNDGFDAVIMQHTPTVSGLLILLFLKAARRKGVPVLVVGHEPPSVYARHLPGFLRPLYFAYERAVFNNAAVGIVHTTFHANELARIGVATPPRIIPHPVFEAESPVAPAPRRSACWAYFGMISAKKGLDLLLQAYQNRPPGHYPPLLVLGQAAPGQEAYLEALKRSVRAEYAGHIRFLGYIEDEQLGRELSGISLMVFPYRWISQSGALAHCCLYRIPYLASDLPYFREFSARYGCGRLFASESVESLNEELDKAAIEGVVSDPAAFDFVLSDLSLSRCTDRLLECAEEAPNHAAEPSAA